MKLLNEICDIKQLISIIRKMKMDLQNKTSNFEKMMVVAKYGKFLKCQQILVTQK